MRNTGSSSFLNRIRLLGLKKRAKQIVALEETYCRLTDEELVGQTRRFQQRLAEGASLDDLLVEAFATVREACFRVLQQRPYLVQVMGGLALHQGYIAEMRTGEGKTLTATMPLYLHALLGKGAILVTPNDYLALRDGKEMGQVYQFLGLSVGIGVSEQDEELSIDEKKKIYQADITYTTSAGLGFDYLSDNLASSAEDKFMRPFHYVIVDEADALLLDNAQTPLIISGFPRVQSNLFHLCNQFVLTVKEGEDFIFDAEKKEIYLTAQGNAYAEEYFDIDDLYSGSHWELNRHIQLALRAHYLYRKNIDYLVRENEIQLLDHRTGRVLEGTRLQSGIHQAIETKEKVKLTKETRAVGSVTYQSLFNLFPNIAGMSGTARQAQEELIETYRLPVVEIPTNQPIQRIDYPDKIYTTLPEKLYATIRLVKELHAKGQPVLMISATVEITQIYSKLLLREGISHSTLTADNIAKEALIIQEAGQVGAVTCATIMAGRGTDIKLGPGAAELGGLAVIGTERMPNSRMDWQLRGRAGRQGEPGMSQFFVSLEDELLLSHGPEWVKRYFQRHKDEESSRELTARRFRRALRHAQVKNEDQARQSRQFTVEYDESLRIQRQAVYALRNRLIFQQDELTDTIDSLVERRFQTFIAQTPRRTKEVLHRYILEHLTYEMKTLPEDLDVSDDQEVKEFLHGLFQGEMAEKMELLQTRAGKEEFYRLAVLKAIDEAWVEEVDTLQQLKGVMASRTLVQRNGLYDYYKESLYSYQQMKEQMEEKVLRYLMLSRVNLSADGSYSIYFI